MPKLQFNNSRLIVFNPFIEPVYGVIHTLLVIIIHSYWIHDFLWCLLIHVYLKPYISYVINYYESKLHSWCIYALPFNMWSNYALGSSIKYIIQTTIVSKLKTQPIQSDSITINKDWNDSRFKSLRGSLTLYQFRFHIIKVNLRSYWSYMNILYCNVDFSTRLTTINRFIHGTIEKTITNNKIKSIFLSHKNNHRCWPLHLKTNYC